MISRAALKRGIKSEHAEHPWATPTQIKRIASDHLRLNRNEYPAKKRRL
jgi:hypothetical protein